MAVTDSQSTFGLPQDGLHLGDLFLHLLLEAVLSDFLSFKGDVYLEILLCKQALEDLGLLAA